jgi:hypothetical protein
MIQHIDTAQVLSVLPRIKRRGKDNCILYCALFLYHNDDVRRSEDDHKSTGNSSSHARNSEAAAVKTESSTQKVLR